MQEKHFGLWKCYSCKSLIPDSIVQTHTVPFRILESQDDNWKHIWKTWQALILSFKWWPCGTSRKLQLFHNISCSCCRKFRPTFALSWVMCGLNKACPGHWNFSPFHQLIKWQGKISLSWNWKSSHQGKGASHPSWRLYFWRMISICSATKPTAVRINEKQTLL